MDTPLMLKNRDPPEEQLELQHTLALVSPACSHQSQGMRHGVESVNYVAWPADQYLSHSSTAQRDTAPPPPTHTHL